MKHAPLSLAVLGATLISVGVMVWSLPLGLVTAGLACWFLEWRIT